MSNQAAVNALVALGREADNASAAAALVQAEGDGALGAFRAAVATTLAPLKKSGREEVLSVLKEQGIRSVPGVSTNVATAYALIGEFLIEHPEEPAVLSGAAFETSYNKVKSALYGGSRVNIGIEKARRIFGASATLEDAAKACLDAAPADSSFAKKVRAAVKALEAVNKAVDDAQVDPDALDLIESLLEEANNFVEAFPVDDVIEIRDAYADEAAAAA